MSTVRADIPDQAQILALVPALRLFARLHRFDCEDADRLVQQTLTDASDRLELIGSDLRPSTWLLSILHGLSRAGGGKKGHETGRVASGMTEAGKDWSDSGQAMWIALARLPLHHREVLVLTDVLGERYEDAALICDCAVGTIKSRLNRARHHMRRELKLQNEEAIGG